MRRWGEPSCGRSCFLSGSASDRREHSFDLEWLQEYRCSFALLYQRAKGRHEDDPNRFEGAVLAEPLEDVESSHLGHHEIEQNGIGTGLRVGAQDLDCLFAIARADG